MKIKMIAVKRHTSVPCIPLTPQFVIGVYKTWRDLDCAIKDMPQCTNDPEAQAMLSAYNTLGDIITAFESDCEPEQN